MRMLLFTTIAALQFSCSNAQIKNKKNVKVMSESQNNPAFSRNSQEKVDMKEEDWKKTYLHPERGITYTMDKVLGIYAWHCTHHLKHIASVL